MGTSYRLTIAFVGLSLTSGAVSVPVTMQAAEVVVTSPPLVLTSDRFSCAVTMKDATLSRGGVPTWRAAMSAEDTLYYVGTSTPEDAPALPGMPSQFGSGGAGFFGAGWDVISGYSSGTLIKSDGNYGTMVYGSGGHSRLQNQILGFNLSEDDPTFTWWQDPTWVESDTASADFYWSPSESSALQAGGRGAAAYINPANETATAATWDRAFPVAFGSWIFPRKMTTGQMGNSVPHGFRYPTTTFIPASVTGTDAMMLSIVGAQGPFGQSYKADGTTDSEWFDASVLVGGARKFPYYLKNCTTGAWSVHQWQPTGSSRGGYSGPSVGVFEDNKRVYIAAGTGSNNGWWYLDFSAGYASHTVSSVTIATYGHSGYANMAYSNGDADGRHFAVGLHNSSNPDADLVVYDFDNGTSFLIDLSGTAGFGFDPTSEYVNFTFDAANSRVLVVYLNAATYRPEYWSITVPSTLTNAAGWVATKRVPSLGDAGMSTTHFASLRTSHFYGKTDYIPSLGVCLVPFDQQRMLAFRPSV